jgi:hypothetical protein
MIRSLVQDLRRGSLPPGAYLRRVVWDAGADWEGQNSGQVRLRVTAIDDGGVAGMVLITGGTFQMGQRERRVRR